MVAGGASARRGAAGVGVKGQTPGVTCACPGAFAPRGADAVLGGWDSPRETLAGPSRGRSVTTPVATSPRQRAASRPAAGIESSRRPPKTDAM